MQHMHLGIKFVNILNKIFTKINFFERNGVHFDYLKTSTIEIKYI